MLFGHERETFVAYDVKLSGSKNAISGPMQQKLLEEVKALVSTIRDFAAQQPAHMMPMSVQCCGFATAAYRECANGRAVLDKLQTVFQDLAPPAVVENSIISSSSSNSETVFPIRIATQKEEGLSGFLTGIQLAQPTTERVCIWDSGGASFQLVVGVRGAASTYSPESIFEGPWGNSKASYHFMTQMQKKTPEQMAPAVATMNPATLEQFEQLVAAIRGNLEATAKPEQKEAILKASSSGTPLVAIGGTTSVFRLATLAAQRVLGRDTGLTAEDLRLVALSEFLNRTDAEIDERRKGAYLQINVAIGKLALLCAVLEFTRFPALRSYHQSVGTCLGLASLDESWESVPTWSLTQKPSDTNHRRSFL